MAEKQRSHAKVVRRLLFVVVAMFGFGFALVPLYNVFCEITGLNGKVTSGRVAVEDVKIDLDRTVTVEFIANLNANMPWDFRPAVSKVKVHPGEPFATTFYAKNRANRAIVGHAVPSVTPGVAAKHFKKTECFCFTEQLFQPGEGRDMPVRFVVDPALPKELEVVTLSYTFFDTGKIASAETLGSAKQPTGTLQAIQ